MNEDGTCDGGGDPCFGFGFIDPGCYAPFPSPEPLPGPAPSKGEEPSCDQLLAQWIDTYLANYNGATGHGSPLYLGLATWGTPGMSSGAYLVHLGQQTGVDPASILGIARAESSLATNPNVRGGMYNIYGNSLHFDSNQYTSYKDATTDAYALITTYVRAGFTTSATAYKKYEGEATWEVGYGNLVNTQTALFGNTADIRYGCDDARKAKLSAKLGRQ